MRVSKILGQHQSLPLGSCVSVLHFHRTLLVSRVSRAVQMDDIQGSCGWGQGRAGICKFRQRSQVKNVGGGFRNLDPYVSPGSSLISKEHTLLQKLKANFVFD